MKRLLEPATTQSLQNVTVSNSITHVGLIKPLKWHHDDDDEDDDDEDADANADRT